MTVVKLFKLLNAPAYPILALVMIRLQVLLFSQSTPDSELVADIPTGSTFTEDKAELFAVFIALLIYTIVI